MAITFTESAAKHIRTQLAQRGKGLGLRVGVKKVGCSGFAYTYDFADELGASFLKPRNQLVNILHGEHCPKIAEGVHRGAHMIGDYGRRNKTR